MRMKLRSIWHVNRLTFFWLDYIAFTIAVILAFRLSPRTGREMFNGVLFSEGFALTGYGLPLFLALGLQAVAIQRVQAARHVSKTFVQIGLGAMGGMLAFVILHGLVKFELVGRYIIAYSLVLGTLLTTLLHVWVNRAAEGEKRLVVVHGSVVSQNALRQATNEAALPLTVVGEGRRDEAAIEPDCETGLYHKYIRRGIDEIIVSSVVDLDGMARTALMYCTRMGMPVVELRFFYERDLERVYVEGLDAAWFWNYDRLMLHPIYFAFKRATDLVVSIVALVCMAPVLPLLMLAIRLQDGGAALYSQERVGVNNRPFRIWKFRTMRVDAERQGAQWATFNDTRITAIGRLLRRTRMDEFPQFWNILRGDMSFIGPRPERPEFVEIIERDVPFYRYRHLIKPGLTGWAQVNYPYGASIADAKQKLSYDLYYLKYASVSHDVLVILRTFVAMTRGAR